MNKEEYYTDQCLKGQIMWMSTGFAGGENLLLLFNS